MLSSTERKAQLKGAMTAARERTLWLLSQVPKDFLKRRVHSFYSPIGWHFGHIARTEEFWIVGEALGQPVLDEHYTFLFGDLPENPKDNRVNLPSLDEIVAYLEKTRERSFDLLDECDIGCDSPYLAEAYAWDFALQHECQHQETIAEMMQLIQKEKEKDQEQEQEQEREQEQVQRHIWESSLNTEWVDIPAGTFVMGSNERCGYDNEKEEHEVSVAPFSLAKHPVTSYQWSQFIEAGGYQNRKIWSEAGWKWREAEGALMPEYWRQVDSSFYFTSPQGLRPIHPDEPVSCISFFEAEAYAKWAGARLPTEEEWEYAARGPLSLKFPWGQQVATSDEACFGLAHWSPQPVGGRSKGATPFGIEDMAGQVWEWTSSAFLPYPGFEAFPYDGYSKDHMKGEHRVCRGGSWATAAPILRCSFRNWYVPTYRQGFLGMRLARS